MAHLTFDWDSSVKKLKSLVLAFTAYKKIEPSTLFAFHLAGESWHLTDWVHKEFLSIHNFFDIGEFRTELMAHCESLKIMHDIANANKHNEVSRPKATILQTTRHEGDFAFEDFDSNDFDVTRLEIHLLDGTILNFEQELQKTIDFWISYFENTLRISLD